MFGLEQRKASLLCTFGMKITRLRLSRWGEVNESTGLLCLRASTASSSAPSGLEETCTFSRGRHHSAAPYGVCGLSIREGRSLWIRKSLKGRVWISKRRRQSSNNTNIHVANRRNSATTKDLKATADRAAPCATGAPGIPNAAWISASGE